MQKRTMKLSLWLQGLIIVVMIMATSIISFPVSAYAGLVIRGGMCAASVFEKAAEKVEPVEDGNYITGLSVNYTEVTSNIGKYRQFISGIKDSKYCVGTSDSLLRNNVKITKDPIPTNPLHAKLSGLSKDILVNLTRF